MHKDNNRFCKAHRKNRYDNERAENSVPELDVGPHEYAYPGRKDRSLFAASSSERLLQPLESRIRNWLKRCLFIALGAGILIGVVIVIIMLAATSCFHHGRSKQSKLLDLVLKIKLFRIIKRRRN